MEESYPSTPSDAPRIDLLDLYSLRYYIDSWIEVSSQPSTSSLSSAATTDDIITTGLRVERQMPRSLQNRNKRKRAQRQVEPRSVPASDSSRASSIAGSSQDEYEESDSESDKVLSGSNEDITAQSRGDALLLRHGSMSETTSSGEEKEEDNDEDDRSTALGPQISSSPFVPQPNAFSHPTQYSRSRSYNGPGQTPSQVSTSSQATAIRHNSSSTVRNNRRGSRTQHVPYNMISPSYQADHDAALRASLSTLLSLGTAVRGAPKNDSPPAPSGPQVAPASSFRLVPESVAMGEDIDDAGRSPRMNPGTPRADTRNIQPSKTARSTASSSAPSKGKRRASKDRASSHASASKKSRQTNMTGSLGSVSPTLMTWVISAGVVVLFSAISFSAGYALGREVGRTEMALDAASVGGLPDQFAGAKASNVCSKDAVKGSLKRLRWGATGGGVSVYN